MFLTHVEHTPATALPSSWEGLTGCQEFVAPTGRTLGENSARPRLPRYNAVAAASLAGPRNTSR